MADEQDLDQRSALLRALQQHIQKMPGTQVTKAKALGITQPRLSNLLRGRAEKFRLDALAALAGRAGLQLNVNAQDVPFKKFSPDIRSSRRRNSPFPVDPQQLGRLDVAEASRLLLRLLRCEVLAAGLSPSAVTLSASVNAADGGIDASVTGVPSRQGLLLAGDTHFQLKTGATFKPWQSAQISKEILGTTKARSTKSGLGQAVRDCLEKGGLYCLVTFGHDLLPHQRSLSERYLTELFQACGYQTARVKVLGQGQLAGEIEEFPSIYCDLYGFDQDDFKAFREWSKSPQMSQRLEIGEEQQNAIDRIREILLTDAPKHIRLVGEPGIGKTRLALEALSIEELAPAVVYVPTGEDFQKSHLFRSILRVDHPYSLVVVIDDCSETDRASILAALSGNRHVRVLTIDHGYARGSDSAVEVIECPKLGDTNILAILRTYVDAPDSDLSKWVELCNGSPRVAHAVGENLKHNPGDVLRPPAAVPIWERFISGFAKTDSVVAREHHLVLRYIALFTRFGFEPPVTEEARFIAEEVRAADPNITWPKFQAIVRHFQDRRILQGRHTLFLVPRALHIYLWIEFWNQYGRDFDFDSFLGRMPRGMRDWFLRLFTYAHQSAPAIAVVRQLLEPKGPLSKGEAATSAMAPRLVRYLAQAEPHATLAHIDKTYGRWTHEELLGWEDGRQDIVWALEYIAVWSDCFDGAVRVLAKMAVAENASNSNNSRGTLIELFSIGLGWASTQATPQQRYPILKGMVTSRDDAVHALGLELSKGWLNTHGGFRSVGPEHQGLRPTIQFWRPKTYGEVFDAWRLVWRLLEDEFQGAPSNRRNSIAEVLINAAPGLIQIHAMSNQVIDTLFRLSDAADLSKRPLIGLVIDLLKNRNSELPEGVLDRIRLLDQRLTGSTLWDRVIRYVIHSNWNEDYDFSAGSAVESTLTHRRVEQLAQELMASQQSFAEHAGKLLQASGHRLMHFGIVIGKLTHDGTWDDLVRRTMTEVGGVVGAEFLAGYLAGVRTVDRSRWEGFLLALLEDSGVRRVAVECAMRSGVSDRVLGRMVELFKDEAINASAFNRFILRSSGSEEVGADALDAVVDALLDSTESGASSVATELLYDYYAEKHAGEAELRAIPRDRPLRALLASASALNDRDHMREFYWGRLAKRLLHSYPTESAALLGAVLASRNLSGFTHSEVSGLLLEIVKADPGGAWRVVSAVLDSEGADRGYRLSHWLAGEVFEERQMSPTPAAFFPVDAVMDWIKSDPERRAVRVLEFLPKTLDPDKGGALTERFIHEFSGDERIGGGLAAHFWTGGWSGPRSTYFERKRDAARRWLSATTSVRVQSWLSDYISALSADIESAKIQEEREF